MTDWYEVPYVTGPLVKVKGFPRPLYPPDASRVRQEALGRRAGLRGLKRVVSRAGRWQWQEFDDAFSNGFAHGKGGNVVDTGLAGVQRQSCSINDTGWLGKTTFDYLRSIRVPEGKPHAGEPCMDATAAKLIDQAFDRFGGHEPAPDELTVRQAALKRAITQLGTVESPSGSNKQKYGSWYGMNGQPWCAIFVTWCFELGAQDIAPIVDSPTFVKGSRYAYVPYVVGDARSNRYGLTRHRRADPRRSRLLRLGGRRRQRPHRHLREVGLGDAGLLGDRGQHLDGRQLERRTGDAPYALARRAGHDVRAGGRTVIALVSDQVLYTINSLEILGIIYLAIALSKLRERIGHLEGKLEQRDRDNGK